MKFPWIGFGLVLVLVLSGCASYQLGLGEADADGPIRIEVASVRNETVAPQIESLVQVELERLIIRDPSLVLVPSGDASDVQLDLRLVGYERDLTAWVPEDTARVRAFNLTLIAEIELRQRGTDGQTQMTSHTIRVAQPAIVDDGAVQAEFNAVPILARDLALAIRDRLTRSW